MEAFSVLVIDHSADWSRWASLQQDHGHSVIVLRRLPHESDAVFQQRVDSRLDELERAQSSITQVLRLSGATVPASAPD